MSTVNLMIDDLDPTVTEDVETFSFSFNGASYLIDLGTDNAEAMLLAFEPYIIAGRKEEIKKVLTVPTAKTQSRDTKPIREWAKANGHTIGEKGRIAASIEEAYNSAMREEQNDLRMAEVTPAPVEEPKVATPTPATAVPAKPRGRRVTA